MKNKFEFFFDLREGFEFVGFYPGKDLAGTRLRQADKHHLSNGLQHIAELFRSAALSTRMATKPTDRWPSYPTPKSLVTNAKSTPCSMNPACPQRPKLFARLYGARC
jgi:hypothetical protein